MARFFWKILAREGNRIRIAKQRTPLLQCKRHCGVIKHRKHPSIRRASLKYRGILEMAGKRARRASSDSLSLEEINAHLNRLKAEMAERKPQRASSKRKILKKRLADLQGLKRGWEEVKGRIRTEAEHEKKKLKALEEEEEDIARKRAMNEEEIEEMRVFNETLNPLLATVLLGHGIQDQMEEEPVFFAAS
ncbi:uncharacterized protein LOC119989518 isoform X2 [Tripterygium wilfordii]|uniref:uncharacterized protein LOC119989518 isoform X2 n=1 Tax=Tripterygium wilfordii TaxID=458696 RepID=UPI0018F853ED|nr:uncharacterized protein LOC119989518 isoform X2 [Tripterygium wilfordii]